MALSVCSRPGCPNLTQGGKCDDCKATAEQQRRPEGNPYSSKAHKVTFRQAVLDADPICVLCRVERSTVADHHPISRRDLVRLKLNPNDPAHGRGLCKTCHDTETAANQPGGWNDRA